VSIAEDFRISIPLIIVSKKTGNDDLHLYHYTLLSILFVDQLKSH